MSLHVLLAEYQDIKYASRTLKELRTLLNNGFSVNLVLFDSDSDKDYKKCDNNVVYNVYSFSNYRNNNNWISNIIRKIKCIVVLIKMWFKNVLTPADIYHVHDIKLLIPGIIAKSVWNKKIVYDSHEIHSVIHGMGSFSNRVKNRINYGLEKIILPHIDIVIHASEERADYVSQLYRINRPLVLNNYVYLSPIDSNYPDLKKILGLDKSKKLLVYIGIIRLGGNRRIDAIINILPQLNYDCHFVAIGPTTDRDVKSIESVARTYGVKDRVHILPGVATGDVSSAICSADLSVIPLYANSLNSKFSALNKLSESCMAGLPIACSDYDNLKRIVEDNPIGPAGKTFDVTSLDSIVRAVNDCLSSENNSLYRKNSRKLAMTYLNWQNEEIKLMNAYKTITSGK